MILSLGKLLRKSNIFYLPLSLKPHHLKLSAKERALRSGADCEDESIEFENFGGAVRLDDGNGASCTINTCSQALNKVKLLGALMLLETVNHGKKDLIERHLLLGSHESRRGNAAKPYRIAVDESNMVVCALVW